MRMNISIFLLATIFASSQSLTQLSEPELELCQTRPKQWRFNGHNYYFSRDQETALGETKEDQKLNWLDARNECRKRCMDTISMESEIEARMVLEFIKYRNLSNIWTSGRLCDFAGCDRDDLKPLNVKGWFWSNTNTKIAPTNATPPGWKFQPWSTTGDSGKPQPDNAEFDINQTTEACLSVMNGAYKDGITWHDVACYHKKDYICEDSEFLITHIERKHGVKL